MMQAFRSSAKLIAIVFSVLMFLFMVTSVDWSAITGGATSVGKVNGTTIDTRSYQAAVDQAIQAKQQETSQRLTIDDVAEIRDQVWEQFIQSQVLTTEYRRHNIQVSPAEVAEAVRNVPPQEVAQLAQFQTDGRFDLAKYQRWLTSTAGQQVIPYLEAQYRESLMRSKLLRVVTADIYLSDAALWQRYRDANETVTIGLTAIIPRNAVPDSAVTLTDAEVLQYYREHGVEFERPATAFMSFVALPRTPDASDSAAALARAHEVRQEIVDGAPFAEVAGRESSDEVSARQGGDLGEFTRGNFVPAFEQVAFSIPLNTVSQPVLSEFGYHLIEVTKRSGDKATARHVLIPIELAGAHRNMVDARADTLEMLGADRLDPAALDTVARVLDLPLAHTPPVQQGTRLQLGREVIPEAGTWAFQARPGEVSPVIEVPFAFYLFRLDSLHAKGIPPLSEIRQAVERAVSDVKKRELARGVADTYVRRLREGSTMAQAAQAMALPYREFGPFTRISPPLPNPVLVGSAFGLKTGQRSGVLDTEEGLYLIQILNRTTADSAQFTRSLDDYRAEQVRLAQQDRVRNYMAALRSAAQVVDRRSEIFRTAAQVDAELPRTAAPSNQLF